MTRSPESWRRICAVLDRLAALDGRPRAESVAEACAAEGISVDDALVASRDSERALWVKAIDALTPQRLAGTDGASYPFWSPDGRFIACFAANTLKKVELATGSVETICNCETGTGGGGTWNREGIILFSKGLVVSPLWQVPASGGRAVALPPIPTAGGTDVDRIGTNAWPQFLPDGRHFLFLGGRLAAPGVYVGRLGSAEYERILPFARAVQASSGPDVVGARNLNNPTRGWYADGFLFFLQQRSLMAQPFDVDRLEMVGSPMRLVEEVEQTAPGRSAFSVSGHVLAYRRRPEERTLLRLTWLDKNGVEPVLGGIRFETIQTPLFGGTSIPIPDTFPPPLPGLDVTAIRLPIVLPPNLSGIPAPLCTSSPRTAPRRNCVRLSGQFQSAGSKGGPANG